MNQQQWQVLKFGGTSVSSVRNWQNIVKIIKKKLVANKRVMIVHSALSGISNTLERIIEFAINGEDKKTLSLFNEVVYAHKELVSELELPQELLTEQQSYLKKMLDGILLLGEVSDRIRAEVLAQGELWSTTIGAEYLNRTLNNNATWLDARRYLLSTSEDSQYLTVNCNYDPDKKLISFINQSSLVVTQGFIAANGEQETVLTGRGGSDTSAAYFASKITAERLEIWTDVEGIFTANPNQVQNARLLKQLDYTEAQEMASAGAKVLHPRAIQPTKEFQIPIYIRSTLAPEIKGTKIYSAETTKGMVKAVTAKEKVTLISMESQGMWQQAGYLADIFAIFKKHNFSIDLVSTSETNITVTLDSLTQVIKTKELSRLMRDLEEVADVELMTNCTAVSIVGQNVRAILHKISPALSIFETYPVYLLSQAASDLNLTFVIDDEFTEKVIASLHELLISNNPNSSILGPTISELKQNIQLKEVRWWQEQVDRLEEILSSTDQAYVYHKNTVNEKVEQLSSLEAIEQVFFAVKANNNKQILENIYHQDLGFETVSLNEIQLILDLFPDIDRKKVFFTPNFANKAEYQQALSLGINLSLDSTYPLTQWADIFSGQSVFLRIDPNIGKGHHENVRTAGATSKFGIPIYELDLIKDVIKEHNISIVGLHAHAGSGILTPKHWAEHARLLAGLATELPTVKYLNLGGGFGIKEKSEQESLNFIEVNLALNEVKSDYPDLTFWIEPGRYLVADAGVLISKVTQVKQKQNYYYVGINTGMNSLMRPALYGSYHPIENLTRMNSEKDKLATIVGPICESTDKLGIEIPFPTTEEGDIVLIDKVGAYGHVMSNRYNLREPAEEFCI
ncbi:bifunctional aspartate kinase/diaminopimelate decarboxylase [Kangiella sp. HZ709]|uniref:bifunctional aspartate kinase/diaminopimelate decarboxylase n=1 Tax=Kangiella sp. HZ709 TaxID=2666328 RepID=UPI0012B0AAD4|nr:bifunctional aspartate kinase/diaminopimelate decarboxylase [Kangiella sp. HZ709]MRX27308.1 bifunctional aspartate kinase/diaminopimelate decarboxylase [Kangiella sp. HZ709]